MLGEGCLNWKVVRDISADSEPCSYISCRASFGDENIYGQPRDPRLVVSGWVRGSFDVPSVFEDPGCNGPPMRVALVTPCSFSGIDVIYKYQLVHCKLVNSS